jgi:hypothetical protein
MKYKIDNLILLECFRYKISNSKNFFRYKSVTYTKIKNNRIFFKAYYFDEFIIPKSEHLVKSDYYKISSLTLNYYNRYYLLYRRQKLKDVEYILKRKPVLTDHVKIGLDDSDDLPTEIYDFFNNNIGIVINIGKGYGNLNYTVEFEKNIPLFNEKTMEFSLDEIIMIMSVKEYRKQKLEKLCSNQETK